MDGAVTTATASSANMPKIVDSIQEMAAIKIQSFIRGALTRLKFSQQLQAVLIIQRIFRKILYDTLNSHRKDSRLFHAFRRAHRHKILLAEIRKSRSRRQWAVLKTSMFSAHVLHSTQKKYEEESKQAMEKLAMMEHDGELITRHDSEGAIEHHITKMGDVRYYTADILVKRHVLVVDEEIRGVTNSFFDLAAHHLPDGQLLDPANADSQLAYAITKRDYLVLMLRLSRALIPDFNHKDTISTIESDWQRDTNGQGMLYVEDMHKSLFELADMWVDGVDAHEYADFLHRLLCAIAVWEPGTGGKKGKWRYKDMDDVTYGVDGDGNLKKYGAARRGNHQMRWHTEKTKRNGRNKTRSPRTLKKKNRSQSDDISRRHTDFKSKTKRKRTKSGDTTPYQFTTHSGEFGNSWHRNDLDVLASEQDFSVLTEDDTLLLDEDNPRQWAPRLVHKIPSGAVDTKDTTEGETSEGDTSEGDTRDIRRVRRISLPEGKVYTKNKRDCKDFLISNTPLHARNFDFNVNKHGFDTMTTTALNDSVTAETQPHGNFHFDIKPTTAQTDNSAAVSPTNFRFEIKRLCKQRPMKRWTTSAKAKRRSNKPRLPRIDAVGPSSTVLPAPSAYSVSMPVSLRPKYSATRARARQTGPSATSEPRVFYFPGNSDSPSPPRKKRPLGGGKLEQLRHQYLPHQQQQQDVGLLYSAMDNHSRPTMSSGRPTSYTRVMMADGASRVKRIPDAATQGQRRILAARSDLVQPKRFSTDTAVPTSPGRRPSQRLSFKFKASDFEDPASMSTHGDFAPSERQRVISCALEEVLHQNEDKHTAVTLEGAHELLAQALGGSSSKQSCKTLSMGVTEESDQFIPLPTIT